MADRERPFTPVAVELLPVGLHADPGAPNSCLRVLPPGGRSRVLG